MTVLQVQSLPALAHQRRKTSFLTFFFVAIQKMSLNLRAVVVVGSCEEGGMISFYSGITAVLDQHTRR